MSGTPPVEHIVIVSGLPRSGTSLMMQMLAAGGMPLLVDDVRGPDASNPRGYYELARVTRLEKDQSWLPEAAGKALKVVSFLLPHLPTHLRYKILFMQRALPEVLASQRQMLARQGVLARQGADPHALEPDDAHMGRLLEKHLAHILPWLEAAPHAELLHVAHQRVLRHPETVAGEVAHFLGRDMDMRRMAAAVDPALHRQRGGLNPPR